MGHVKQSSDQILCVKTKNGEKEHGYSGTKTANFQHGKQACSPLSYDGCCWVHALYEGYKSLCFHHVYIATADNLHGRTTFRAIDILARNIIIISTAIIWQPGEYHLGPYLNDVYTIFGILDPLPPLSTFW